MQNVKRKLLIVGLGNPGEKYAKTRHNLGALVVEEFSHLVDLNLRFNKSFVSRVARGCIKDGVDLHLLLPETYMNESGQAVRSYLDYYKFAVDEVIVVYDDIAFELGDYLLATSGGFGGHNGLKSIGIHLGHKEFARLRMGIGNAREGLSLADYVLSRFKATEVPVLEQAIRSGAAVLESLMTTPIATVMNRVNTRSDSKIGIEEK